MLMSEQGDPLDAVLAHFIIRHVPCALSQSICLLSAADGSRSLAQRPVSTHPIAVVNSSQPATFARPRSSLQPRSLLH